MLMQEDKIYSILLKKGFLYKKCWYVLQGAMKQFKDYQCIWDDNDDGLVSFIEIYGEEFQKCLTFMKKPSKTGLSM